MSEWESFIAVFWLLWAIDGVKIAPRAIFTVAEWLRFGLVVEWPRFGWSRNAWTLFSRLSAPGPWWSSWRVTVADVPLAISPRGICNRPAGSAGRPTDAPHIARAWAWDEVREVAASDGWLVVNGEKFCHDTGHVSVMELRALANLVPAAREAKIRALLHSWLRPAHLQRRMKALCMRTRWVIGFNCAAFMGFMLPSMFFCVAGVEESPDPVMAKMIDVGLTVLPWVLVGALSAHFAGVFSAWLAKRRLPAVAKNKRGMNLFTAALMPPQALKLRSLLGEGYFPAQHPLAVLLAFGSKHAQREAAFNTLSDLRWPIGGADDPPLAREIAAWFREALRAEIEPRLQAAGLGPAVVLAAPKPDNPASCTYCPRCGDQFVAGRKVCPHGVELKALAPR